MLRVLVERAGEVVHDGSYSNKWLLVGRDAANDLVLDDPLVSARHLTIRADDPAGAYRVIDSSSNGTFLNGEPISVLKFDAPTSLQVGELSVTLIPVLRSGTDQADVTDLYRKTAIADISAATRPGRDAMPVPEAAPGLVTEAELRCVSPGGVPRAVIFDHSALIGRAEECDLRLSAPDISRRHCLIVAIGDRYVIKRLSKKNPVRVNSRAVAPGDAVDLHDGDVICICDEELLFLYPATRRKRDAEAAIPMEAAPNVDLAVTRRACSDEAVSAFDVVGFLGSKTWRKFEEKLMAELESGRPLLLDLGYLLGMDGSGIASLARVIARAEDLEGRVRLIRVTPRVADLLELSKEGLALGPFICRTEQTAITRLRGE